MTQLNDFNN